MFNNEFRRPVSVGLFCKPCGEQFSLAIMARSNRNNATTNQHFA